MVKQEKPLRKQHKKFTSIDNLHITYYKDMQHHYIYINTYTYIII